MATRTQSEEDIRLEMLNSFLSCPHRDTDAVNKVHQELVTKDPVFYAHLGAWYFKNGEIRDHKEVFVGTLAVDSFLDNRETGLALFRRFPVFLKRRVIGFIKGKKIKIREKTGNKIQKGKKVIDEVKITEKTVGLFKNIPTAFKKDVEKYLRWIEADNDRFDSIAMKSLNDLKGLYASLSIKPSPRAQKILFEQKYPEDSKLNVYKEIADSKTPDEAAILIVKNKIPFTVAVGLVDNVTPSVLVALINSMSPQEVINNIASLEEKGAMNNPDTKAIIDKKLKQAEKGKNVAALKPKTVQATGRIKNEETRKKLDAIADSQVRKSGTIKIPTAVLFDKSGSLSESIEIGKRAAALLSGVMSAPLHVVAFDSMAREIVSAGPGLSAWEKAFQGVTSHGGTSIGCALDYLMRKNVRVEQIIVITDEDENGDPRFWEVFPKYVRLMGVTPNVVLIHVNNQDGIYRTGFSDSLKAHGIAYDLYKPDTGDYYALPGLVTLLSRNSKIDLLYEIMDTPLPVRKDFDFGGVPVKAKDTPVNEFQRDW